MADQSIALQVKVPEFDLGAQLARVGQIQATDINNQRNTVALQDETDQSGALRAFRTAKSSGDPNALDKLSGYPEIQAKIHAAYDAMTPDELKASFLRADKLSNAIFDVRSEPPDTKEMPGPRTAKWNKYVDEFEKDGTITKAMAKVARDQGPTPEMLDHMEAATAAKGTYKPPVVITPEQSRLAYQYTREQNGITADTVKTMSKEDLAAKTKQAEADFARLMQIMKDGRIPPEQLIPKKTDAETTPEDTGGNPFQKAAGFVHDIFAPPPKVAAPTTNAGQLGKVAAGAAPPVTPAPATGAAPTTLPTAPVQPPATQPPTQLGAASAQPTTTASGVQIPPTVPATSVAAPTAPPAIATPANPRPVVPAGPPARAKPAVSAKPAPPAPAPLPAGIASGGGTEQHPYVLTPGDNTAMEAAAIALPDNTWFINPASGQPVRKKPASK